MHFPIILDVGHALDDHFAVALAACSPELELVAITTVHDGNGLAARIVRTLLDAYGRSDVPVISGPGDHHESEYVKAAVERLHSGGRLSPRPVHPGVTDFFVRTLTQRRDITFVATGPLTNLANLLKHFPHHAANIREILFMGGWATQALPDYNVRLDPEAAAEVLSHDIALTAIGYEVTRGWRVLPPHFDLLEAASAPGPRVLNLLARTWREVRGIDTPTMSDPVGLAYLSGHLSAAIETTRVAVRTDVGPGRGAMYQDDENGRQIRMFARIETSNYMDFLMERVTGSTGGPDEQEARIDDLARHRFELNTAYRLSHFSGWTVTNARHSSHIVALVLDGEAQAKVQGRTFPLGEGSVLYIPSGQPRTITSDQGMSALWFYFDVLEDKNAARPSAVPALPWPHAFSCAPDTHAVAEIGERVVKYWQYARPEGPLLCNAALVELITHLHGYAQQPAALQTASPSQQAVLLAKRWIETRVTEPVTLDEIAKYVSLDKYHLLRLFKEIFGVPPLQYQRQLRMEQARKLLQYTMLSISDVASSVGYGSITAFTRAFKRYYGVPPSEMR